MLYKTDAQIFVHYDRPQLYPAARNCQSCDDGDLNLYYHTKHNEECVMYNKPQQTIINLYGPDHI